MAVPEQTPYIEHTGNGVTTSFALKFQCESKDHLIVLVDEVEPPIATWSLTGGNVVFTTAPAAGKKITLQRNTPFSRATDYQSYNNSFRPPAVNNDFDRVWRKLQELGLVDWLLSNRIDALKNYVDVQDAYLQQNIDDLRLHSDQQDSLLQQNIENLKGYVDDKDDELRSYLLAEIQAQGVALDQLDEYYNYLMQRLAQIAADGGWDASLIAYGPLNQKQVNDGVNSIADLLVISSPKDKQRVYVNSYHAGLKKGGGWFVFDSASTETANGGTVLSANDGTTGRWLRQIDDSDYVTPEMFGAKADGVTDDYDAIMAAINSWKGGSIWTGRPGQTVKFALAKYYSRDTINLKTAVRLLGEQSAMGGVQEKTQLLFPLNKDGIVVNRYNTNGATGTDTSDYSGADGAMIKGISVSQVGFSQQVVRVLDFNTDNNTIFVQSSSAPFVIGDVLGQYYGTSDTEMFKATVTSVINTSDYKGGLLTINGNPASFTLGETITGGTSGATATIAYLAKSQQAIALQNVAGTFADGEQITGGTSGYVTTVNQNKKWPLIRVYGLSNITGALANEDGYAKDRTDPNIGDHVLIKQGTKGIGILLRARAHVENVIARGWGRYGVAVFGANGNTNANCSIINNVVVSKCNLDGLYTRGGDSNASKITAVDASNNGRYGINDSSFLGNHYFSCHTASNLAGAYYSSATNNFSVFVGCYSEGDVQVQPFNVYTSKFGQYTTVIGGDHGAGINNSGLGNCSILAGLELQVAGFKANNYSIDMNVGRNSALQIWAGGSGDYGVGNFVEHLIPHSNGDKNAQISGGKYGFIREDRNSSSYNIYALSNRIAGHTTLLLSGGGGGTGFSGYPVVTNGVITDILIKNAGSGYTSAVTIKAQGTWAGLQATADVFNGKVVKVTVTNSPTNLPPTDPVLALKVRETYTQAGADNIASLGTAANRWSQVYAGTGTINTSDEREKQQVRDLTEAEKRVAVKLKSQIKAFKFNDAVAEKGDNARIHFGVIAQEVKSAFESEGLVAEDYAILCYDEWEAEYREITEEITVTNDAGEEVTEIVETGERELTREAGSRYGVRYEELLAFIISAL